MPELRAISIPVEHCRAMPIALSVPEIVAEKDGYVKVRLDFLTCDPRHVHSVILADVYDLAGPYLENICILLPQEECFDLLECYAPYLGELMKMKAIGATAKLHNFEVLVEDDITLAYVFN